MPETNPIQNLEQVDQIDQQPEAPVAATEERTEALDRADRTLKSAERLTRLAEQDPERAERSARIEANRTARIRAEDLDAKTYDVAIEQINALSTNEKTLIERTVQVAEGRMDASNGTVKIALVMRFQEMQGLESTGIIDQTTTNILASLNQPIIGNSAIGRLDVNERPESIANRIETGNNEPTAVAREEQPSRPNTDTRTESSRQMSNAELLNRTALGRLDLSQGPEPIVPPSDLDEDDSTAVASN
jgi:peptidoglycan hydrolase-like protein with peptidoglycan-binding domain